MKHKIESKVNIKLPRLKEKTILVSKKSVKEGENENVFTEAFAIYNIRDWICVVGKNNLFLEKNSSVRREIASLTKMMTLYCTLNMCKKFKINPKKAYFRVTANAASTRGTSAELQSKEWATIDDLLYGMMLPSGNDAATALSENLGAFLYYDRIGRADLLYDLKSLDVSDDVFNLKIYTEQFVKYMNTTAKELGMKETTYVNPHGLDPSYRLESFSVVEDQAIIAKSIYEHSECKTVICCVEHTAELKTISGKDIQIRKITWQNTNKLLKEEGYKGGKTGQTAFAGNCLASIYENQIGESFVVIILGCPTKEARFTSTKALVDKYIKS